LGTFAGYVVGGLTGALVAIAAGVGIMALRERLLRRAHAAVGDDGGRSAQDRPAREATLDPGVRRDVEVARIVRGGGGDDGVGLLRESLQRDPDQLRVVLELGRCRQKSRKRYGHPDSSCSGPEEPFAKLIRWHSRVLKRYS
jgi:hypothetical protein